MGFAKLGSEQYVNTTTAGEQYDSAVVQLIGGDIVVAWTDANGSAVNVRGQILNADGATKDGAEFMLNTTLAGDQSDVSVTALGDGGFAAAWTSAADLPAGTSLPFELSNSGYQNHIATQVYAPSGGKVGAEQAHQLDVGDYPYVFNQDSIGPGVDSHIQSGSAITANLAAGGSAFELFAVEEIYAYRSTIALPTPLWSNEEAGNNNIAHFVTASSAEGLFVDPVENVTWDAETSISVGPGHPANYNALDQFRNINAITTAGGATVVAYERHAWVGTRSIQIDFGLASGPVGVGADYSENPAVAELLNGNIVAVWKEGSVFGGGFEGIAGQLFSPAGAKIGGEFSIDASTSDVADPAVAALADGRFVAVWTDAGGDGSGSAIMAQIFTADGFKSGAEFLVNTVETSDQHSPTATGLANGDFLVTWTSEDGATADIKSQVVDAQLYTGDGFVNIVYGGSLADDIFGGDGNDLLRGGAGGDDLGGGNDNDALYGEAGDDYLNGGLGDDDLHGGGDDDTYVIFEPGDDVFETEDNGLDTVLSSIDYTLGDNVENLSALPALGGLALTGNELVNTIQGGNFYGDTLSGLSGDDWLEGNGGDDTLLGGNGSDYLFGGEGGDTMEGGRDGDTYFVDSVGDVVVEDFFFGDTGFDYVSSSITYALYGYVERLGLDGTANIDGWGNGLANNLYGNSGDNDLYGLAGIDDINGSDGADRLYGGTESDDLDGGSGADDLYGEGGADTLTGGTEDDELDGGTGADAMAGGTGNDLYVVDNKNDAVTELFGAGDADIVLASINLTLGSHVENLWLAGTAHRRGDGNGLGNSIVGNSGSNALTGHGGDDTLYGFGGNDTLKGGAGTDTLDGGDGIDTATYSGSTAGVYADLGANLYFDGDATGDSLSEIENLAGSSLGDILVGDAGVNVLTGNNGNDTLAGAGGDDTTIGGRGNDIHFASEAGDVIVELAGEGTADEVRATLAAYTLGVELEWLTNNSAANFAGTGNAAANRITGNSLVDTLSGLEGGDTLIGLAGADSLEGGAGADSLDGGTETDTATYLNSALGVTVAIDASLAATGDAVGDTFVSIERLTGSNTGDDHLRGDGGVNRLLGGGGADTLEGQGGNDTFLAGLGADILTGGLDNDFFDYTISAHGSDTITDFNASGNDTMRFTGTAFGGLAAGALDPIRFAANATGAATTADHRFVYETGAGVLRFDADGTGAAAAIVMATLTGAPLISAADIVII